MKVRLPLWLEHPSNPRCRYLALEEVHDNLRRGRQCPLGADHVGAGKGHGLAILDQGCPELIADRDHPARFPFARCILETDSPADVPLGVAGHPPSEPGYLLGPQAGLGRQKEYQTIPGRLTGLSQIARTASACPLLNVFACFPNPISPSLTGYCRHQGAGMYPARIGRNAWVPPKTRLPPDQRFRQGFVTLSVMLRICVGDAFMTKAFRPTTESGRIEDFLIRRSVARPIVWVGAACVVAGLFATWVATPLPSSPAVQAQVLDFDDRFPAELNAPEVPQGNIRLALSEGLRLAELSEGDVQTPDLGQLPRPAPRTSIPLPKSRPAAAEQQVQLPQSDDRTLVQKLAGLFHPQLLLASATPEDGLSGAEINPAVMSNNSTAVYVISDRAVYLPSGTRLEAHSGLGLTKDDPRHVGDKNVGATPPAVYELKPREQLFHGVQALRMNPVGGDTLGREGLLVHSFMLGPDGDSNGCVSIRDYDRFLTAFQRGEIKRLIVVPTSADIPRSTASL
jgi:Protein of unknown function (DUF2778)